jgi:hypothetical protein
MMATGIRRRTLSASGLRTDPDWVEVANTPQRPMPRQAVALCMKRFLREMQEACSQPTSFARKAMYGHVQHRFSQSRGSTSGRQNVREIRLAFVTMCHKLAVRPPLADQASHLGRHHDRSHAERPRGGAHCLEKRSSHAGGLTHARRALRQVRLRAAHC